MASSTGFAQVSLAATIAAASVGTYMALSPPNITTKPSPATNDLFHSLNLTHKHITKIALAPLGFLALHTSTLVLLHPDIPTSILRNGAANGLNTDLITWSPATSIPLALILCADVPLRLIPYSSLGKNFTFALTEPDRLTTTGIYRYVQHPSYTGFTILLVSSVALLCRLDGVLSCWIPPQWYETCQILGWPSAIVGFSVIMSGVWTRVQQEERMLQAKFGVNWETWHAATARFIPWIF